MNGKYISSYSARINQTPSEQSGRWAEKRGESLCMPKSEAAKEICAQHGVKGVQYTEGVPDFSPFAEETVNIGNMTGVRENSRGVLYGRDGKATAYVSFEDGEPVSISHHADKESIAELNMKYDEPSNFQQADILTAQKWTAEQRDGRTWSAADIAQYRQDNALTWHECNDMSTMQLVPTEINADFNHLGGVGEVNAADNLTAQVLSEEEASAGLEEDLDHLSEQELAALDHDFSTGHYDDDGNWISNDESQAGDASSYSVDENSPASTEATEASDYGIASGALEDTSAELESDFGVDGTAETDESEAASDYGIASDAAADSGVELDSDYGAEAATELGENEAASDYGVDAGTQADHSTAPASDYSVEGEAASTDNSQGDESLSQTLGD